jgi:hypothetical protein
MESFEKSRTLITMSAYATIIPATMPATMPSAIPATIPVPYDFHSHWQYVIDYYLAIKNSKLITFPETEYRGIIHYCVSRPQRQASAELIAVQQSKLEHFTVNGQITTTDFGTWVHYMNQMRIMIDHMGSLYWQTDAQGNYLVMDGSVASGTVRSALLGSQSPVNTFTLRISQTKFSSVGFTFVYQDPSTMEFDVTHVLAEYNGAMWSIGEVGSVPKVYNSLQKIIADCKVFTHFYPAVPKESIPEIASLQK